MHLTSLSLPSLLLISHVPPSADPVMAEVRRLSSFLFFPRCLFSPLTSLTLLCSVHYCDACQ